MSAAANGSVETNVKVAVRCRPMSTKETNRNCACIVSMPDSRSVKVVPPPSSSGAMSADANETKQFTFDHCYFSDSTQQQVYKDLGEPIITQALEGTVIGAR